MSEKTVPGGWSGLPLCCGVQRALFWVLTSCGGLVIGSLFKPAVPTSRHGLVFVHGPCRQWAAQQEEQCLELVMSACISYSHSVILLTSSQPCVLSPVELVPGARKTGTAGLNPYHLHNIYVLLRLTEVEATCKVPR